MIDSRFYDYFSVIRDFRQQGKVLHKLFDILFIAVAAGIAGADEWNIVVTFAKKREEWFRKFLELPNGIPSKDTFRRVFCMVDPKQFEKCFIGWTQEIARVSKGAIIAIDGKTMCGAKEADQEKSPVHIVNAWVNTNKLVLGQVRTDEKSNEITAIPELLDLLFINGCIITIDAMGTQKDIARKIIKEKKADYVLALKMNHENLYKDVESYFQYAQEEKFKDIEYQFVRTSEKGHGRIETREYYLVTDIGWLSAKKDWEGLKAIGMAVSRCERKGKVAEEIRYFIASITSGSDFAHAVREHWGVESMHWILDVTFNEDKSRIRKENEPENMALLKRLAMNILRLEKDEQRQVSFREKRFMAAMDEDYLEKVLIHNIV